MCMWKEKKYFYNCYCTVNNTQHVKYGPVTQRITRLTTDQKIPGSNPGRIDYIFSFPSKTNDQR